MGHLPVSLIVFQKLFEVKVASYLFPWRFTVSHSNPFGFLSLLIPGISYIWVRRIPTGIRAFRGNTDRLWLFQRFFYILSRVDGDYGSQRTFVVDPLGIFHRKPNATGRCIRSEFVVFICLQCGRVFLEIRHRMEQNRADFLKAAPQDIAFQHTHSLLIAT